MDTHPMVQSNDTLTDCLNGTLITMNGNEVILQNDMGNRRVDKAFLPPGYEPVGMKEYGGVIYVAAYNPITNKSQIGSFPSPQKKLSSTNEDLCGYFNLEDFFTQYNCTSDPDLGGITVINSDSYIIPLTKNISLRAGDKFAVYSSGLYSLRGVLTNYDNTSGNKAYSPKNRTYTLQLGVLNSQNEFVDITKTLCRWKNINGTWQPVIYDEEKSDIFKFNDGYFISDSYVSQFNVDTIADALLIKERQKIAANTYSYKLVGPLYLKAILNHIQNFNYNIYGLYDKDAGSATLWIEGFLTYNCPDHPFNTTTRSNGDYANFEEGTPDNDFGFDLYGDFPNSGYQLINPDDPNVDYDKSVYNPNTNTYTVKIVRKYEYITPSSITNKKFNYVIGVKADKDHNGVYIKGLSVKGTIDLSLLGSNQVKYSSWRFYNNQEEGSTLLTFAFEAYPEYGKSFGNLRFKFHNVLEGDNHDQDFYYPHDGGDLPMYNGRQTISFNWEENGFKERKIYEVTTEYNIINNKTKNVESTETIDEGEENSRWLLTTGLFNEFYNNPIEIPDYCNVPNDEAHKEFYNKMKISYGSASSIIDNTSLNHKIEEGSSLIASGILDTTSTGNPVRYVYNNIYNLQVSTNVKLSINDENSYPDYIYIKNNEGDNYVQIVSADVIQLGDEENPKYDLKEAINEEGYTRYYNDAFQKYLHTVSGLNVSQDTQNRLNSENKLIVHLQYEGSKNLTGYIQYNDIYVGKGESIEGISNAFCNLSDLLKDGEVFPTNAGEYGGLLVSWHCYGGIGTSSKINGIVVNAITKYPQDTVEELPNGFDTTDDNHNIEIFHDLTQIAEQPDYSEAVVNISDHLDKIYDVFNNEVENTDLIFLYVFVNKNRYATKQGFMYNPHTSTFGEGALLGSPYVWYRTSSSGTPVLQPPYTKVWWKMPNGQWAVFARLFQKEAENFTTRNEQFSNFVINSLGKDIIYCMYDKYTQNSGLYAAKDDYAYYGKYSIPIAIKINYGFQNETNVSTLINNIIQIKYNDQNIKCGNLSFSINYNSNFGYDLIELNLDSYLKFYDTIENFNTDDIKNVYIRTGQMQDSSGERLKTNQVYYYNEDTGELEKIYNSPFYIDSANKTTSGKNRILYNKSQSAVIPTYNVQLCSGGELGEVTNADFDYPEVDILTALYYDKVNIVAPV